jgi:hypothetical protein
VITIVIMFLRWRLMTSKPKIWDVAWVGKGYVVELELARARTGLDLAEVAAILAVLRICSVGGHSESGSGGIALGKHHELGDGHLEVAGRDEASPEDTHDISSGDMSGANLESTEPETLDEHGVDRELRGVGYKALVGVALVCSCTNTLERARDGGRLSGLSVEGLDGGNGSDCTVDEGSYYCSFHDRWHDIVASADDADAH